MVDWLKDGEKWTWKGQELSTSRLSTLLLYMWEDLAEKGWSCREKSSNLVIEGPNRDSFDAESLLPLLLRIKKDHEGLVQRSMATVSKSLAWNRSGVQPITYKSLKEREHKTPTKAAKKEDGDKETSIDTSESEKQQKKKKKKKDKKEKKEKKEKKRPHRQAAEAVAVLTAPLPNSQDQKKVPVEDEVEFDDDIGMQGSTNWEWKYVDVFLRSLMGWDFGKGTGLVSWVLKKGAVNGKVDERGEPVLGPNGKFVGLIQGKGSFPASTLDDKLKIVEYVKKKTYLRRAYEIAQMEKLLVESRGGKRLDGLSDSGSVGSNSQKAHSSSSTKDKIAEEQRQRLLRRKQQHLEMMTLRKANSIRDADPVTAGSTFDKDTNDEEKENVKEKVLSSSSSSTKKRELEKSDEQIQEVGDKRRKKNTPSSSSSSTSTVGKSPSQELRRTFMSGYLFIFLDKNEMTEKLRKILRGKGARNGAEVVVCKDNKGQSASLLATMKAKIMKWPQDKVVGVTDASKMQTWLYRYLTALGLRFVHYNYVFDCVENTKELSLSNYELPSGMTMDGLFRFLPEKGGKTGNNGPTLFKNGEKVMILCPGNENKRDEIAKLCEAAGATIAKGVKEDDGEDPPKYVFCDADDNTVAMKSSLSKLLTSNKKQPMIQSFEFVYCSIAQGTLCDVGSSPLLDITCEVHAETGAATMETQQTPLEHFKDHFKPSGAVTEETKSKKHYGAIRLGDIRLPRGSFVFLLPVENVPEGATEREQQERLRFARLKSISEDLKTGSCRVKCQRFILERERTEFTGQSAYSCLTPTEEICDVPIAWVAAPVYCIETSRKTTTDDGLTKFPARQYIDKMEDLYSFKN